jgi:hypothetical protein
MDFGNDNMTEQLNAASAVSGGGGAAVAAAGDDDDAASQSSQRSGASLLERIRAQRQREAQQKQQQQQQGNLIYASRDSNNTTPSTIQVPQYNPVSSSQENDHFGRSSSSGDFGHSAPGTGSFFTDAWNTISTSMETGMASLHQEDNDGDGGLEASDALLAPSDRHHDDEENYSIARYFMTFVNDVYGSFLNLPVWIRVIIIFALVYSAFKLL